MHCTVSMCLVCCLTLQKAVPAGLIISVRLLIPGAGNLMHQEHPADKDVQRSTLGIKYLPLPVQQVTLQLYMLGMTCVYYTKRQADVMDLSSGPVLSCLHHIQSTCKLCNASGCVIIGYRQGVSHYLDSANHRHVKQQRDQGCPQAPFQRNVRYSNLQNNCSCCTCLSVS